MTVHIITTQHRQNARQEQMKVSSTYPVIGLLVLITVITGVRGKRCKAYKGKFFNESDDKKGRCKRCEICPPGQEWNKHATIRTSKEHGDLECYPCKPCEDGFYKEFDTMKTCSPCLLECGNLNRYLDVACGGVKRGHCGSCLPGFEDTRGNTEMPCTLRQPREVATEPPKIQDTLSMWTKILPLSTAPSLQHRDMSSDAKDILFELISGTVVIVIGILAFIIIKCCFNRNNNNGNNSNGPQDLAQDVNSSTRLFNSNDSIQSRSVTNPDLETDGPTTSNVRGELQSVGIFSKNMAQEPASSISMQYPSTILSKDHYILPIVAKNIFGDKAQILFVLLRTPKQTLFAEKELFERKVNKYADYMLNILIDWVIRNARDATLKVLCEHLYKANLYQALNEIHDELSENGNV